MRKPHHTATFQAEMIALGVVVGAEAASQGRDVTPETVRKWMARAGKAPADAIGSHDWQALGDLARSQVAASLASGKVRPKDAMVIAAIAQRNVLRPPTDVDPETEADEQFWLALEDQFGEHAHLALIAAIRRSDDEPEADQQAVWEWVAAIPDLPAWREERSRADHDAMVAQLERNRRGSEAWPAHSAGLITAEERDAWIASGRSPIAAQDAELADYADEWVRNRRNAA